MRPAAQGLIQRDCGPRAPVGRAWERLIRHQLGTIELDLARAGRVAGAVAQYEVGRATAHGEREGDELPLLDPTADVWRVLRTRPSRFGGQIGLSLAGREGLSGGRP